MEKICRGAETGRYGGGRKLGMIFFLCFVQIRGLVDV
jgi:hypothetical protein